MNNWIYSVQINRKRITEIADVHRIKKGEVVESGTVVVMLSANGGKVEYIESDCEDYIGYASIKSKGQCIGMYLYFAIQNEMPEFLARYKTGINLVFENLKYLEINVPDIETQIKIVQSLKEIDKAIEAEENEIRYVKDMKKSFLGKMFI